MELLCIKGKNCFTIDVGNGEPGSEVTNGTGKLSLDVAGGVFKSLPGPGTTKYDNDAINMNIPGNSTYGKWIKKSRQCGADEKSVNGNRKNTTGCVGVPCSYWPSLKASVAKGATVNVCRGVNYETSRDCGGKCGSGQQRGKSRTGTN